MVLIGLRLMKGQSNAGPEIPRGRAMKCLSGGVVRVGSGWNGLRKVPYLTLLAAIGLQPGWTQGQEKNPSPERSVPATGSRAVIASQTAVAPVLGASERTTLTLHEAIGIAGARRAALSAITDYSATFTKTERIKGKLRKQEMEMKLRAQPFSVHLKYQSKKEAGRQAVYVAGRHDGNLLVLGYNGRVGTLRLNPNNPFGRAENRYPVTRLGMAQMMETALATWEQDAACEGVQPLVAYSTDGRRENATGDELLVTYPNPHPG